MPIVFIFIHYIASYVWLFMHAYGVFCNLVYVVIYIHIMSMKSHDIIMIRIKNIGDTVHITNFIIKIFVPFNKGTVLYVVLPMHFSR